MEEPEGLPDDHDEQRRAEAAMEEFLRAQEEEEGHDHDDQNHHDGHDGGDAANALPNEDGVAAEPLWMNEELRQEQQQQQQQQQNPQFIQPQKPFRLSYVNSSFLVAFAMMFYALRTQQQWYLALVYLSSSKWAYIVLGNALIATLVSIFSVFTKVFLNGLRLHEAEGLGDFFRWNITETCLALTMFRSELNIKTGILFLVLVLAKCLHWVTELREQHLRMTDEAVAIHPTTGWPGLQWPHLKLFICMILLQLLDILAVIECGTTIIKDGPSVALLFAFEGAILLVSVMSSILLWYLHVLDGLFQYAHETRQSGQLFHGWIHPWKDYKATLIFAVEVQAQAAKFFFYVVFFGIVMTYYGLPVNLFREVFMSFQSLKQRLVAFGKYRQLMANMNRFENPTEDELEEAGSTCIICRDEMMVTTTKRLPGCGHLFHKSCLREWLVQQQSCPTCRGDISANQERQRQRDAAIERQRQAEENQEQEEDGGLDLQTDSNTNAANNTTNQAVADDQLVPDRSILNESTQRPNLKLPPIYSTPQNPVQSENSQAGSLDDDRKLAPEHRGKHVRIATPQLPISDDDPIQNERPAFPAFYKVSNDNGAAVYNNGSVLSFEMRKVPYGVVVLGLELSWRSVDEDEGNCLMVRVPDGWIRDSELYRVTSVSL